MEHENRIREVVAVANEAVKKGNHPFGATLELDGEIVLSVENSVNTDNDVTRHAEMNLISLASKTLTREQRARSIMYCSTEPCAMCSGAAYWAGINHVVYGCSSPMLAQLAGDSFALRCQFVLSQGDRAIKVEGPVLEEEAALIHRTYWKSL